MGHSFLLSLVLLALACATVPLGRRLTGDYFSPGTLVLGTWAATLSLFFLGVIPYADIRPTTFLFVTASVGALVAMALLVPRSMGSTTAVPAARVPEAYVIATAVLGLVGVAWYVWSVADTLGLSAFVDRPWRIRFGIGDRTIPSRYLILQFLCIATPILAVALALAGQQLRRPVWLLVGAATLGTWVSTDRTQFFVVALTTYFMYALHVGRRLSLPALALRTSAVLIGLGAYFLLIGVWMGKTPANLNVDVRVPVATISVHPRASRPSDTPSGGEAPSAVQSLIQNRLRSVSTLYLYATASYAALDVLLENPQPRTHGLHTIYPVARLLERLGLVSGTPPSIAPFVPLGLTSGTDTSFNTYTFLYYPLTDFGPFGAIAYAAAIGALSGLIYGQYRRRRNSAFWLMTMGHLSAALVLTVFVNKFNNTASWYVYVWTCLPFLMMRWFPAGQPTDSTQSVQPQP